MLKITKEEFQNRINEMFPDEEIEIVEYSKATAPGRYKCLTCGEIFSIYKMGDLLRKKHCCNACNYGAGTGEKTLARKQRIQQTIEDSDSLKFICFGYNHRIYKPTVEFECEKCGNRSSKQLIQFELHPFCSYCSFGAKNMNTQGLQSRLPEGYTILEEYKGTDEKILFRHECGFIWKTTPHNLISGCGCPKCAHSRSKGEKKIIAFLQQHSIDFESEKKFDWCGMRRYDFYLPQYQLVIEYMGVQHYEDIVFHGERRLKEIQEIDREKKEKALSNGLLYLEIPYTDFAIIDQILAQRLNIEQPEKAEDIV